MLESLGLSREAAALYRELLRVPFVRARDISWPDTAVAELTCAGLASFADGDADSAQVLLAMAPDDGLARFLAAHEARLVERQHQVDAVRRDVGRLRASFAAGRGGRPSAHLVDRVSGREAVAASLHVIQATVERELLTVDGATWDLLVNPVGTTSATPPPQAHVNARTVYDRTMYQSDRLQSLTRLAQRRADGEAQRLVPRLPLALVIADDSVALVITSNAAGTGLLVRSKPFVDLLTAYFEQLWVRAVPIGGEQPHDTGAAWYAAIPALLAAGLSDDEVAHQLGQSVRSVRRRIAQLMEEIGATTRFQAGVLAQRAGLLRPRGAALDPAAVAAGRGDSGGDSCSSA